MINWTRTRCESNGCVELARFGEHIHLRSSRRPDVVAILDLDEWAPFIEAAKAGEFDVDKLTEEPL